MTVFIYFIANCWEKFIENLTATLSFIPCEEIFGQTTESKTLVLF